MTPIYSHEPAIGSNGTIYVTARESLYAFNPDGTTKWTAPYQWVDPENPGAVYAWVTSSPAIDSSGVIYVNVSTEEASLYGIYAMEDNGTSATVKWRQNSNLNITEMATGSPAIDENLGRLYVGRGGSVAVDAADSYIYALALNNGAFLWRFATDSKRVYATPAIGSDGTIYAGTSAKPINTDAGIFFVINTDGTEKSRYDTGVDFNSNTDTYASAAIGDDGTIYVSPEGRYIYAFNSDGTMKKKYDLYTIGPETSGNASIVMSSIAIGSDGTLYCGDFYHTFDTNDPSNTHTGALYAIYSFSTGLANTQWPKIRKNNKNTGRK